ncbi:glycosyltransferase family 4 protein [Desulfomonile tiedjei]|uniref:Glycosyltransferase n=1 Tax=Desulfomonile tiedjei (strain ATCC 49306 / DSM 6799 / DCB-1) TaxID=706587 RepID=I4C9P5_DESTA|nr:glycosyltransferase family 4 protein [Desulfomonile tiedjei]AFM26286.1 glycosyltransferase [Desulfomonile tiedjei DSM 6799]
MSTNLVLFFTRGVSLRTWGMMGMLQREIAIYRRLMEHDFNVSFLTYGDASDVQYTEELGGIRILCNETGLPWEQYESELLSIHSKALADCDVIKTNQTNGAQFALQAAKMFGKPLVARCGYMWSFNWQREFGYDSPEAVQARSVEETVFRAAEKVVVTTEVMAADIAQRIPEASPKTCVIPNYVDTDVFRPQESHRIENSLVFVGRIAPEKNLEALLEAVSDLPVTLTLIGEGRLRPGLQKRFSHLDGRVSWEGNIPNMQLPDFFNRSQIFILPSLYEGHPKTLIEAMSCGLPVIGGDSPGIREIISHGFNGYLSGTDSKSLHAAIRDLIQDAELRLNLGRNARTTVMERFSLDNIVKLEMAVLRQAIAKA